MGAPTILIVIIVGIVLFQMNVGFGQEQPFEQTISTELNNLKAKQDGFNRISGVKEGKEGLRVGEQREWQAKGDAKHYRQQHTGWLINKEALEKQMRMLNMPQTNLRPEDQTAYYGGGETKAVPVEQYIGKGTPPAYMVKRETHDSFAFTPMDAEFNARVQSSHNPGSIGVIKGGRHVRQNPNDKPVVAETKIRAPLNIRKEHRRLDHIPRPGPVHETDYSATRKNDESGKTFSTVTIILFVVMALVAILAVIGLMCVTSMSKKVKAAEEVDYPAYGVTGPSKETNPDDTRLARQAQRSHFRQHKGQIINMSRAASSISESDEEAELGDYTVYECPGLGASGAMEIKNPLFTDDAPLSPSICEVVKQQPTD